MSEREVSKDDFFAKVGPMDVNPRVDGATLKGRFYTSHWETPGRHVVGRSVSDGWGIEETQFFLGSRA